MGEGGDRIRGAELLQREHGDDARGRVVIPSDRATITASDEVDVVVAIGSAALRR